MHRHAGVFCGSHFFIPRPRLIFELSNNKIMKIKLDHHFLTTSHNIKDLFEGTQKISTFCSKLENQAGINTMAYPYEKYVGDGFEFLVELLIKLSPADNRIGISDYQPIKSNKDNGVDGYGRNLNNKRCAIQVKYRTNNDKVLTAGEDKLDSFMTEAMFEGVLPEVEGRCKNHFIFTTADGLHYYTNNEKFRGSVKCIGWKEFRELLDNNIHFWESARGVILENLPKKTK